MGRGQGGMGQPVSSKVLRTSSQPMPPMICFPHAKKWAGALMPPGVMFTEDAVFNREGAGTDTACLNGGRSSCRSSTENNHIIFMLH